MDSRMQIYLTNKGDYFQRGILTGTWVKLPIPEEELRGYYWEDIFCGSSDTVLRYIDTQRLGRDIHLENGNGTFTSHGYLTDLR